MKAPTPVRIGLCAACLGVLGAPGAATGATVGVSDGQLEVAATADGMNVIDVRPEGLAFRVHDSTDSVTAGEGCVLVSPAEAVCGGMIMVIRVQGSDGEDLLGLWGVKVPVIAHGGDGDDLIETGRAADEIDAGGGLDAVEGGRGDDAVKGGAERDRIEGGPGDDALDGESGEDVLLGGGGEDDMSGGAGGDLVNGGAGDDDLSGDGGDNVIVATRGGNTVTTGTRTDTVYTRPESLGRLRCRLTRRDRRRKCDGTSARVVVARPPQAWPPRSGASASGRARTSKVAVTVLARWPSDAERLSVTVAAERTRKVRVCVRLFDIQERFIGRFPRKVWTTQDSIKSPRLRTNYALGKLRKKGCQRKFR